jgi:hypothetical protein
VTATIAKKVVSTTKKKAKTVEEHVKDLRNDADSILADLDDAHIFIFQKCEDFPSFDRAEIDSGSFLGQGGFSDVFEVLNVTLTPDANDAVATEALVGDADTKEEGIFQKLGDGGGGGGAADDAEEDHCDSDTARSHMSKRCLRFGSARCVIKRSRGDLSELDRVRGVTDLAIEIQFFRVIWHPNIVKMRAISSTSRLSADAFLMMDRLHGTLEDKIEGWIQIKRANQGCCMGLFGGEKPALQELMKERLLVACDLCAAINHSHEHR